MYRGRADCKLGAQHWRHRSGEHWRDGGKERATAAVQRREERS
eukprot:CAMPEP_0177785350 /NCGR_PEP_ID=MMETSP0491_2-20121128/20263_1 /TAXON_ID=63592 /ORGANISM="Tetraselmis chuii, Strain PLY429" /LENGTH=42 /DNA_ID= /DNA_START= /DNA_END= /DNA_ORIENTATION=